MRVCLPHMRVSHQGGGAPQLSADRGPRQEKPLEFLVQRFAVDPATRWRRVYSLGSKAELLVVVRQRGDHDRVTIDLITDIATDVVLHWGVFKPGAFGVVVVVAGCEETLHWQCKHGNCYCHNGSPHVFCCTAIL